MGCYESRQTHLRDEELFLQESEKFLGYDNCSVIEVDLAFRKYARNHQLTTL
jgi:hypothetical protein